MRSLDSNLLAAQKLDTLEPAIKITLSLAGQDDIVLEEDRLLKLNHLEEPWRANAKEVEFDNSDCYFTEKALQGYKAVISYGLITKAGKKYSDTAPLWITWQQLNSVPGRLSCLLTMLGIPDLMDEDDASASYIPLETDTKTVKTLIREIAGDTGVTMLPCYNHCQKYDVVWESGYDTLADTYKPKDSFRIYLGGSRLAAIKRLMEYTGNVLLAKEDGKLHILKPTTTGADYDYTYSLASGHTFFSKAYRKTLVIPNYIMVKSQKDDDPQYSGYAQDTESYALLPKRKYIQTRLASNAEATSIAQAILNRYKLNAEMGSFSCPINVGQELYDYILVKDIRQGDERAGNIGSIIRTYNPEKHTWNMRFTLGAPPVTQHIKELYQDLKKAADKESTQKGIGIFEKLYAKDSYIEHLNIDNIDAVWLDPDSNIDLTKIGDNLDSLPDGEAYARVKSLHLDDGQVKLDENVWYKAGYDPNTKRRNFTTTPTTPYDLGDLWHDDNVVKRCTTARASGAYVAGDWTATTLDAIGEGTTYRRAKSAALTADGLVILDQVVVGTYGLVKETDISAGHIKLSTTVKDGEWYLQSGVLIDATKGVRLYGTDMAFGTFANVTDARAGTNWQTKMDSGGKFLAGGGNVILDDTGLTTTGQYIILKTSAGVLRGYLFGDTDLTLASEGGHILLNPGTYAIYCYGDLIPSANKMLGTNANWWESIFAGEGELGANLGYPVDVIDAGAYGLSLEPETANTCYLGRESWYYYAAYINNLYRKNESAFQHLDDIALIKAMKPSKENPAIIDLATMPRELLEPRPTPEQFDVIKKEMLKKAEGKAIRLKAKGDKREARLVMEKAKIGISKVELDWEPSINTSAEIGLLMGAIRQLVERVEALEVKKGDV